MDESMKSYISAVQSQYEANNAWSAAQAQKQMDFQERMSSTAHQREVADLKAAGLNPVLSAGGSGAAAMTGASAERSDSNIEAMYGLMAKAFDAQIKQAEAMQVSAKAASGSAGFSNPTSSSEIANGFINAFADWLYRKSGIKQTTSIPLIQAAISLVGENSDEIYKKLVEWGFIPKDAEIQSKDESKGSDAIPQHQKVQVLGQWYDVPDGMSKAQAFTYILSHIYHKDLAEYHAAKGKVRQQKGMVMERS